MSETLSRFPANKTMLGIKLKEKFPVQVAVANFFDPSRSPTLKMAESFLDFEKSPTLKVLANVASFFGRKSAENQPELPTLDNYDPSKHLDDKTQQHFHSFITEMMEANDTDAPRKNNIETRYAISPSTEDNPNGIVYVCYNLNGKWLKQPMKLTEDPAEYEDLNNEFIMLINPTVSNMISHYASELTNDFLKPQRDLLEGRFKLSVQE